MKTQKQRMSTETLVLGAVLTALVIVLQIVANNVKLGPCSLSLAQVPIIIGIALCGVGMGAWLGLVFGIIVLASGGATDFLAVNALGTIVTVIVKGVACGYVAGLAYKLVEKFNRYAAVILAAIVCPLVNTGIFFLGCLLFFMELITEWATALGFGESVVYYMFVGLAGFNFLFELGSNLILSPVIVRLLNIRKTQK